MDLPLTAKEMRERIGSRKKKGRGLAISDWGASGGGNFAIKQINRLGRESDFLCLLTFSISRTFFKHTVFLSPTMIMIGLTND